MASGFYQALFLTQSGPTVNINLAFTCFYLPLNFVEFASKYLRKDIRRGLSQDELRAFTRIVRNMLSTRIALFCYRVKHSPLDLVETNHTGRDIRYRIRGFGLPADKVMFMRGERDANGDVALGEEISVAAFFAEKYKKLEYPSLPCIDGMAGAQKRANWLPMEVASVSLCAIDTLHARARLRFQLVPWERSLKPLDSVQRALVTKKCIIKPEQRYGKIMNIVNDLQFETDPFLKELNIRVDAKEMLQVRGKDRRTYRVSFFLTAVVRSAYSAATGSEVSRSEQRRDHRTRQLRQMGHSQSFLHNARH